MYSRIFENHRFLVVTILLFWLNLGMGFDAINSERNKGTLSRIMAQPIHRDDLLNAKFAASLIVISIMFITLGR